MDILEALEQRENELKDLEAQAIHNLGFVQGRLEECRLILSGVKDAPQDETPTDE